MGPYEISALPYFEAGFSPLPALGKLLHVKHASGRHPLASRDQIEKWTKTLGVFNVALRLPPDVIALDIDAYKGDLERLKQLEDVLGKLPKTWNSDSRGGAGGKILFRVPPGIKWQSNINGITIIQHTHRYVMVLPSYNSESNSMYRWYEGLGGNEIPNHQIPEIIDLPDLSILWIQALKKADITEDLYQDKSGIFIDDLDVFNDDPPCDHMLRLAQACKDDLLSSYNFGLHDTGLTVVGKLITAACDGHPGIIPIIYDMADTFCSANRARDIVSEWNNILTYVLANVDISDVSELDTCKYSIDFVRKKRLEQSLSDFAYWTSEGIPINCARKYNRRMFSTQ